jgi:cation transport ATPase
VAEKIEVPSTNDAHLSWHQRRLVRRILASCRIETESKMSTVVKLRLFFAVVLICCLFLPLSQCTSPDAQGVKVVQNLYVFKSAKELDSWLGVLAFSAPLVLVLARGRSRSRAILTAALSVLLGCAALYFATIITFWSQKVLVGGYLAVVSSGSSVVLALIEIGFLLGAASRRDASQR